MTGIHAAALLAGALLLSTPGTSAAAPGLTVKVTAAGKPAAGAMVHVAGELAGRTGKDGVLAVELPAGAYPVQVRKAGMAAWRGKASVGQGPGKLAVQLRPRTVTVTLRKGKGPAPRVTLEGPGGKKAVQISGDSSQLKLPVGTYELKAALAGHVPYETSLQVGRPVTVALPALVPLTIQEARDWRHTVVKLGLGLGIAGLLLSMGLVMLVLSRRERGRV